MIKEMNHVGISVSNLERSIEFYRGLGMEIVLQGTFEGARYEELLALKGTTGRAVLLELKGAGVRLELFEFDFPSPKRSEPDRPVCDHGITHFCLEVEDIEHEYERLRAAGTSFHCSPLKMKSGNTVTYARDPDGNVFELLQKPTNKLSSS